MALIYYCLLQDALFPCLLLYYNCFVITCLRKNFRDPLPHPLSEKISRPRTPSFLLTAYVILERPLMQSIILISLKIYLQHNFFSFQQKCCLQIVKNCNFSSNNHINISKVYFFSY